MEVDRTFRFLIGGKLVRPDQAGSFPLTGADGTMLGAMGDANRKDVRNAVEAARTAFPAWFESAAHLRAQILYFWGENLAADADRFAAAISAQTGAGMDAARQEVRQSVSRLFDAAAYADKFGGTVQPVQGRRLVVGLREPVGVLGIKAPDESALLGLVSLLGYALAMANTVVVLAGRSALSAMDLMQVAQHSDIPPGVLNLLTARDPDGVTRILAEHEDVDGVWYFGSREGSGMVERASAGNMKQTWCSGGAAVDWPALPGEKLLRKSTQVKNIWVPYGV
jgi:aldehyde dehydrogenase (NAD+)